MKRLAIIAGKGHLPIDVAKTATADGYDVLVLPIEGQADADFTGYQASSIRLGSIGKTRSIIIKHGIDQTGDGWQGCMAINRCVASRF